MPLPFHQGNSLANVDAVAQRFLDAELPRLCEVGALEPGRRSDYVSRAFLVPKPGCTPENPKFRLVFDLRHLNKLVRGYSMKSQTLKDLRHMVGGQDWAVSFDISDGFYALGVAEEDRDYFTVQVQGKYYRFAALPMGFKNSPYHFNQLMVQLVRHLRAPTMSQKMPRHLRHLSTKKLIKQKTIKGIAVLQYVDDFLLIGRSAADMRTKRDQVFRLLTKLGLPLHPTKGEHEPTQCLVHLGLELDLREGVFRAPATKLTKLAALSRELLHQARRQQRWVPVKKLASLAGQAQFLYLAIPPARFYLRELHVVLASRDSWAGQVKLSNQLRRDLEWWTAVPQQHNGRPICRPVETAYMTTDASDFAWVATLNNRLEARGFFNVRDRALHITHKELMAVRHAVESFLPHVKGRRVVLDGDNQAVIHILSHLTSRSPDLMNELRKLWHLLDTGDIHLRPRWISTHANVWADRLSREFDTGDWRFNPRHFRHLDKLWGTHTVDRFSSDLNKLVPRFNSAWHCPGAEAVDSLALPDAVWRAENNWCNPPWKRLQDLTTKLKSSGAKATVVCPVWPSAIWYQQLMQECSEVRIYPPARDLFLPGQVGGKAVGSPAWHTAVIRVPLRPPRPHLARAAPWSAADPDIS